MSPKYTAIVLFVLLIEIATISDGQSDRIQGRRRLKGRQRAVLRERGSEGRLVGGGGQLEEASEENNLPVQRRPGRPRVAARGRDLTGGRVRGTGGGGVRGAGGGGVRGAGRMRGGGGGRFRPRRPRPRRPLYDDYDYYYGDYYYYDQEYPEYTDYDSDYSSSTATAPSSPVAATTPRKKTPFSSVKATAPALELPDVGIKDYDVLIKELWKQFLEEKTGQKAEGAKRREPEEDYDCPPSSDSYYEPDEDQCDKFYECNIKGEISEHLCPDGFVFDISSKNCDHPVKVNCTTRPLLQEPQPSVNCSRANGFFPWPANISCQHFWDCREGKAYKQTCPSAVIFDPQLNTCATPDQSSRTECKCLDCKDGESNFLGFSCPVYTPDSVLRFGNHDRLPHPDDCQKYFSCLRTGGPRLATCPRKTVFNNATGQCGEPRGVSGCEDYWTLKLAGKEDDDEYYYD